LYWTTYAALDTIAGIVPTVMHPLVHDEPPLRLSLFDAVFRAPDALALATPEELDLIRRRFRFEPDAEVVGIGVELDQHDPAPFRAAFLPDAAPYLLYVGRLDPMKGAVELLDDFIAYKRRNPRDDIRLVFLGEALVEMPQHDDVVVTGFVDYALRDSAIAGCFALAMPSYFESFSMVLTEAFAQCRPALVQGRCAVLRGHAVRSGAAIPYEGFAQFEAALSMLREDPALADAMGAAGRAYVEREYRWDRVLDRYEQLLARTMDVRASA
jgi:glycosyltransferase involved in cell wall biosynthesis